VPTVGEVSEPYANYLTPVLAQAAGVCQVCRTSVAGDWSRCFQCEQARNLLPSTADAVVPIALAVKGEQLAHELWTYKYSPRSEVRAKLTRGLAAVLWRWLARVGHGKHFRLRRQELLAA